MLKAHQYAAFRNRLNFKRDGHGLLIQRSTNSGNERHGVWVIAVHT
ncbi:Uncharacterised protein [Vibrio cholerae]|nr:Uncharacterised protein [Vibrio cholerae]CSI70457.1 Uncharacterised protein [Vibrio cholerae]